MHYLGCLQMVIKYDNRFEAQVPQIFLEPNPIDPGGMDSLPDL